MFFFADQKLIPIKIQLLVTHAFVAIKLNDHITCFREIFTFSMTLAKCFPESELNSCVLQTFGFLVVVLWLVNKNKRFKWLLQRVYFILFNAFSWHLMALRYLNIFVLRKSRFTFDLWRLFEEAVKAWLILKKHKLDNLSCEWKLNLSTNYSFSKIFLASLLRYHVIPRGENSFRLKENACVYIELF